MARIQTISGTAVPSSPLGIKADAGRAMAVDNANIQMAGAIQQTAQVMAGIQAQRQAHVERGMLAKEETIRSKTAAQVQKYMDENQGTPEEWGKEHEKTWKAYEEGRATRSKDWSTRLKQEDDIQLESFRSEIGIRFSTQQNTALIRQSNARMEANANDRLDNGDVLGAAQWVNSMNLTPEAKRLKLDQVVSAGLFRQYDKLLTETASLPPAARLTELQSIEAGVMAKDDKGNYKSGTVSDEKGNLIGSMGEGERMRLAQHIKGFYKAAQVEMARTGSALVDEVKFTNGDPALIFGKAYESGAITPEIAAVYVQEARYNLRKEADAAQARADIRAGKRDRAAQAVDTELNRKTGTRMTFKELEKRMAIGIDRPDDPQGITPEAYAKARDELIGIQESEMAALVSDTNSVNNELYRKLGQGITRACFSDKAQMTPNEQRAILKKISDERISVGSKAEVMKLFFKVQEWDLREAEVSETDGDRQLSKEEKDLRSSLIEKYRDHADAYGAEALGSLYMKDMETVGTWYRNNPKATDAQRAAKAKEFLDKLGSRIDRGAGRSILGNIPAFQ